MKYLLITTFIFVFSQNIYADEIVSIVSDSNVTARSEQSGQVEHSIMDESLEPALSSEGSFQSANIEFSKVDYYEYSDSPNYKPKERVIVGGIVPFIPIRTTIDASVEDPGLLQKSVSFMMYFKQNF